MAIYIDSAERDEVEKLLSIGIFKGVTTNPTLLRKSGLQQNDLHDFYKWAVAAGSEHVFMQTRGFNKEQIYSSALRLLEIGSRVIVKIPCVSDGIKVANKLVQEGANILLTAVYHPVQAQIGNAIKCWGIAPYVGRMTDNGVDGIDYTVKMAEILKNTDCQVLAASIRDINQWAILAAKGISSFTISPSVINEALDLQDSTNALINFESCKTS